MDCEERPHGDEILRAGVRRKTEGPPPQLPPRPVQCPQSHIEVHLTKNNVVIPRQGSCALAMDNYPVMQFFEYSVPQDCRPEPRLKKYVFLCSVCGGLASLLGGLFLGVYLILRSYTSSLGYFETIPTYIPAAMLLLTGLGIMCLARRKNRYALLIKVCGVFCLMCAGTCILVTVTTTVIHMSRLQSLKECVYTTKTLTCTCYSILLSSDGERPDDDGVHYVFNSIPNCEVIHGTLYSCLRAMFGLSVIGILVCIFCCMLVYQLLSHERKKMYWEQLELRCRYLYGQPTRNQQVISPPQRCSHCACSQQFPYSQPADPNFDNRQWTGGRIGNLYSPNPEPVSSGWGWRLPWSRDQRQHQEPSRGSSRDGRGSREGHSSNADSQYGFSEGGTVGRATGLATVSGLSPWGPPPPYSDPSSPRRQHSTTSEDNQVFSPRVKYLREKRPELSESEVYFADVSSCCNGSIRNDSLVYDEPQERTKTNHRFPNIPEERASPDSEVAEDGSEEDDPELVSFSRRNNLTRSHRNRLDLSQATEDFSPMSVDSVGQGDSPWGSPDFLAPDAQYETIPEPIGFNERRPPTRDNFPCPELNTSKQSVDRCNNPHYYGGEYQTRYTNSDGLIRHHYEEIQEPATQRVSDANIGSSPVFASRLFPNPPRRHSPECIALVDESLCSHNDSSCRCSMSINSRVEDNVPN